MADLMRALEKKLEGDIAVSKANIAVYNERPAGVGEPVSYTHLTLPTKA